MYMTSSIFGQSVRRHLGGAGLLLVLIPALFTPLSARAQALGGVNSSTESILYSFTGGGDGADPQADLIQDAAGNLYGTTLTGGNLSCSPPNGCGTVFKVSRAGKETVLYSFSGGADGASPIDLIRDAKGNLYGVAGGGGSSNCSGGCGVVYKLSSKGKETVLYSFSGGTDGQNPLAKLIFDANGSLYGTTGFGGDPTCKCGTVFKLSRTGKLTTLHTFTGGSDGANPLASRGLIVDVKGNLYGTTQSGGTSNYGTVYKVSSKGKELVLHSFTEADGRSPYSSVIFDAKGNLYGTTGTGGNLGGGVVYKLTMQRKETVLYNFSGKADGALPGGSLIWDAKGNLYGTTYRYGDPTCKCGTVFKLGRTGKLATLHTFMGGSDGANPSNGLTLDAKGSLYGTTTAGGSSNAGTVFKLTP